MRINRVIYAHACNNVAAIWLRAISLIINQDIKFSVSIRNKDSYNMINIRSEENKQQFQAISCEHTHFRLHVHSRLGAFLLGSPASVGGDQEQLH
jgi:hypothetical protein